MSDETSAPANVNPGDKIAGYRLEEPIGQGGMAVVYRAHDERLDRRVALKLLAPGLAADTAFRTRFIRESRAAAAVDHPNIIPVYDAGDAGGFLYIAMRYVQGGDVRSLLADGQVLSAARTWNIISQVAAALDAAHAHDLIHRDVKPANMLLDAGGRSTTSSKGDGLGDDAHDHVYLSDFGISKQTLASHLTSTGQFVGTLDYIAPEQIEAQTVDGRADQYSLACAAYEMLTGEPPFRRDLGLALINAHISAPPPSLLAARPDLPRAAGQVIARAMAKSPAERFASCTDFAANLGRAFRLLPGTPEVSGAGPTRIEARAATGLAAETSAGAVAAPPGPPLAPLATTDPRGRGPRTWPTDEQYQQQQPPQPGWPGDPAWQQQQPARRSGRRTTAVLAAVLAVIVLGGGGVYAYLHFHSGNGKPQEHGSSRPGTRSSSVADAQAASLSSLLGTSVQTHATLQTAVLDIEDNCSSLSSGQFSTDVAAIQAADSQRQTEYASARGLNLTALRNATMLKSDLIQALFYSLQADNNFLTWARQEQNGCLPLDQSKAFQTATSDSTTASTNKASFASLWNPEARSYGQQMVTPGDI